jgi:ATP-dependent Clp protease ATP-binding subunit ClpA
MFERFDPAARQVVTEARAHATRLGQPPVGTQHLLLALLTVPGPVAEALTARGLTADVVEAETARHLTESPTEPDREALRAIGIDLDDVRSSVESAFGSGALERARLGRLEARRRWIRPPWRWRRRPPQHRLVRCQSYPFAPRSKKVLELSLREALRLKARSITPTHIGLGLLREGQGLACAILASRGVPLDDLRRTWEASGSAAA